MNWTEGQNGAAKVEFFPLFAATPAGAQAEEALPDGGPALTSPSLGSGLLPHQGVAPSTPSAPPVTALNPAPPPSAPNAGPTLRALAEEFAKQNQHLSPSTLGTRRSLLATLGKYLSLDTPVGNFSRGDLKVVRGQLSRGGLKSTTINDIFGKVLRPVFALAVEMGVIGHSPLDGIKGLRKEETIRQEPTWEQAHQIIDEVEKRSKETAQILRFMLYFGLGQAEVRALRGEHVDLGRGVIRILRRKTRKEFSVPIFPYAKAFIDDLQGQGLLKTGCRVFDWRNPRKAFETARVALGLPQFSLRALRRTFIIRCIEQGVETRLIASWQGHRDAVLIHRTYGRTISERHAQAQINKLT